MKGRSLTAILGGLLVAGLVQLPGSAQGRQGGAGTAPANETLSQSYRGSKARDWEFQKVAPIKVFDNLHYVGCLAVADTAFCRHIQTILKNLVGRSVKEIGDLDLSQRSISTEVR